MERRRECRGSIAKHWRGRTCNKKIQRARERTGGVRTERKPCLVEDNMTGNYDPSSGEVETPVTLMGGGVSEKGVERGASLCLDVDSRGNRKHEEWCSQGAAGGVAHKELYGQ